NGIARAIDHSYHRCIEGGTDAGIRRVAGTDSMTRTRVALVTESTYPCARGGVAVWCDQLIRNLPGVDFTVVAITPTTREPVVWELPPNVVDFRRHAAWDRLTDQRSRRHPPPLPAALQELVSIL